MPDETTKDPPEIVYLREPEVCRRTGLSPATIFRLERAGEFPKRHRLSSQAVGWREDEVQEWLASRPVVHVGSSGGGGTKAEAREARDD